MMPAGEGTPTPWAFVSSASCVKQAETRGHSSRPTIPSREIALAAPALAAEGASSVTSAEVGRALTATSPRSRSGGA
jgi:hypothetical protein